MFYYPVEISIKTSSYSDAFTDGNGEFLPLCIASSCLQKCQHNLFYEYSWLNEMSLYRFGSDSALVMLPSPAGTKLSRLKHDQKEWSRLRKDDVFLQQQRKFKEN